MAWLPQPFAADIIALVIFEIDGQNLVIPPDTPPGTYYVWVGAFDKETGDRIEMGGPGKTMRLVSPLVVQP